MSSTESAAAWSEVAPGWERRDAYVSDGMRPVTERLLAALDPQPGETILEVGAGTGEVGRLVAKRVSPGGRVLITDQAAGMVEAARRGAAGIENVELRELDAQAMDLESASVDGVVSRLAYMLVPDPAAALAETRRVLRAGGRLAFAVWTAAQENPWGSAVGRTMVALGHAEPPAPDAPGPFRLADILRLRRLVANAGFVEESVSTVDVTMRYASFDDYWEVTQDLAMSLRDALARLPRADAEELRGRVAAALAPYEGERGLEIPGRARVVAARAG